MLFTQKIYKIAAKIPRGKVVTYGQLAKMAGSPRAARAVGSAMKHNPDMKIVPCHRVVASNGALTGYSVGRGIATKRQMLLKEGVSFIGERVNLKVSGWKGVV
jgi:O-6-methylguanine DNA methyltransferase